MYIYVSVCFGGILEMAKVKALYSYTYDYEGSKISFTSGDEFQLLAKVNNDWWHVRRWINKGSQDIYIPAVYVKELGDDASPLYQNMSDLKRQVEEFKKKESSTPPPPTARKPRPDRGGSDKTKTAAVAGAASPEHKTEAESVADRAKKLAENLQAKKSEEGVPAPKTGSGSPLVTPKRSQSTRRDENPVSNRSGQTPVEAGGTPVAKTLAVAPKQRSQSINMKPTPRGEKESTSHFSAADTQGTTKSGGSSKSKLPPPVLPKAGKPSNRPKSMVMVSPTESQSSEDPFASALQLQLTEQMKKVRSVTSVGATTTAGDRKPEEAGLANGKVRLCV